MSSITLIGIAGLAVLLVIWVLVRRLTQRSPKVSRCLSLWDAVFLVVMGAAVVVLFCLFIKKAVTWTPY